MPQSGGKLEWMMRKYFQCPAQLPSKADSGSYYSISLRENLTSLWIWVLDYKESWVLKNWCFWTMVLEKILKSPLDSKINQSILKEINPEYSLEGMMLKLQYFGHLMRRSDSLEKTLMLGKPPEVVMDRKASCAAVHGVSKSWTQLSVWTELNWS